MQFPEPVIAVSIEPKTKADQEKLGLALAKLMQEDPTFRVHTDAGHRPDADLRHGRAAPRDHRRPPGARVQGRRQRRQAAGRLQGDHHAPKPRARARFIRQTGGRGQYGHAKIRLRPKPEGEYVFNNKIVGGVIPKEFIKPIEQGIQEALETGPLAGYPVTGVEVDLYDGSLPRRRLLGDRVQDRRLHGVPGRQQEGPSGPHGADHGGRGRHARGVHGRRHRRRHLAAAAASRAWRRAATPR